MSLSSPGSAEIRDYLLRRMTDTARGRFEEAYFRDDTLLDRIEAEEDALVSDYVLGHLSDGDRRLFEQSLLGTPYYRERVETTSRLRLKVGSPTLFPPRPPTASAPDARLFPGRTGTLVAFSLLTLLLIAALLSALRLKSDLARARRELAARPAPSAGPAAQAGVVPLAQTVVLGAERAFGPTMASLRRAPGGAILLSFPRALIDPEIRSFSVVLSDGRKVAWESAVFPSKERDEGDVSLRLPPGVPPAGSYSVLLRTPDAPERPETLLGILEILD
ncbi:MAG: hypothetical protein ACHQM4_04370 [Thermoanaerobaculia bacterium]